MLKLKWIVNKESGFTLVEILIGMALFSILSLSVWSIMNHASNSSNRTYTKIEAVENARVALDFMIDEIRRAQKIKIDYLSPTSNIILGLDINGTDGILTGSGDVEFSLVGNEIRYNGTELVSNIQSVTFEPSSFDQDNDGKLDSELDVNKDGLIDKNLKITIETMPQGDMPSYKITGEVSIRYKELVTN